jgi:glyoxylase-like metal-dependent hydrolase (beta-lactamase superfamily II)
VSEYLTSADLIFFGSPFKYLLAGYFYSEIMKIANYQVHAMETGVFFLDGGAMFGVVPKVMWSKTNPSDSLNRIALKMRSLLIIGEGRTILIDTGAGEKLSEKMKEIYNIDTSVHSLSRALERYHLGQKDISDVILTHLHFDHTGGSTELVDGIVKPTFPNATYYVQREQYEWAQNPSERDKASYFPENFVPLEKAGQLRILDGECELFPGISVVLVNGHTPGQQLTKVSGERTLLYCADLIPTSSHVPIPYVMGYDLYPLTTVDEKKKILFEAEKNGWILVFEHDPYAEAAILKKNERGIVVDHRIITLDEVP